MYDSISIASMSIYNMKGLFHSFNKKHYSLV